MPTFKRRHVIESAEANLLYGMNVDIALRWDVKDGIYVTDFFGLLCRSWLHTFWRLPIVCLTVPLTWCFSLEPHGCPAHFKALWPWFENMPSVVFAGLHLFEKTRFYNEWTALPFNLLIGQMMASRQPRIWEIQRKKKQAGLGTFKWMVVITATAWDGVQTLLHSRGAKKG